ncbi:D-alanyl-D-alanine carboxypeptidase family protein [Cognatishimia sp. WU-CL00825]|uniref:D-alanyl-D-alanine carboxypeptidase family protein n=1 Tax=Cognatishimia sp. WU-CL00825 TaxID=3127658 RepID=UPI00310B4275
MLQAGKRLITALLASAVLAYPAHAFETRAKAAFVLDQTTGTILMSKNADEALPPASMSKLMTLYMAFEAVRKGSLKMEEKLPVSQHAMSYGGSTMFLDTTDRIKVADLLRGIIVLSGNDACAVIAETLSPDGTEAGFARQMTLRAREMGMTNSTFVNSNGWPAPGHRMSMRDLALLASRLINDFPEFYPMFSETEFKFDGRARQNTQNRNPLLKLDIGADGLKTGHTNEAGYGLVGSAKRDQRRVIFAVSGMESAKARAEVSEQIVNWAFRQFSERKLLPAGKRIAEADVWRGAVPRVGLVTKSDVNVLLPVIGQTKIDAEVVYNGPLKTPIQKGDKLADLVIRPVDLPEIRVPLVAETDVSMGGFTVKMRTAITVLMTQFGMNAKDAT